MIYYTFSENCMRICRIVFELWTKIVSGGQKNCAYLKNTSIIPLLPIPVGPIHLCPINKLCLPGLKAKAEELVSADHYASEEIHATIGNLQKRHAGERLLSLYLVCLLCAWSSLLLK